MASIQERKDAAGKIHFRVQIRLRGFPPEQATFERKTDARKWAAQTEAAIREGRYFKTVEGRRHTFGEMIDRYIANVLPRKKQNSRHSQAPRLEWWRERLGSYTLADVTPPMIAEARDALLTTCSPTTAIHYLAVLSHCYNVAVKEWEWFDSNPLTKVTKPQWPRGRVRFLDDAERKALLAACKESPNPCLYDIVVLALSSGMRYSEIMTLTWADVDLDRAVITLQNTKNGERRAVPLVGHAMSLLKEHSRIRRLDNPHVFPAPRKTGEPINIKTSWTNALKAAGIENFRFHDLRHSAASYLAMNGATTAELAEILGHKTLAMVKRYSHLSHAHTSGVVSRMNAAIFGEPETEKE